MRITMAVSVFSFVGWCTCGQLPIDAKDSAQRDVEARSKKQKGKPREKQLERFFSENTRTHVSSKVQVVPNSIPSRWRVARGRKKGDRAVSAAAADAAAEDCVLNASFFFTNHWKLEGAWKLGFSSSNGRRWTSTSRYFSLFLSLSLGIVPCACSGARSVECLQVAYSR